MRVHVGGGRKTVASFPGQFKKLEERAWYLLFAHVLNYQTFQEFQIIPSYLLVL